MLKLFLIVMIISGFVFAKDSTNSSSSNTKQYYSGKFGFYSPDKKLNDGILFGIDGITEFNHYDFFLSGAIDLYQKKTFDFFNTPKPNISDQLLLLIPLHINGAYQLAEIPNADTKFYLGAGGGYSLYFYSASYSGSSSGGILGGGSLTNKTTTQNGGNVFFSVFGRILIGKIFIEPRFYFASESTGSFDGFSYAINPSGFAITLGFQY